MVATPAAAAPAKSSRRVDESELNDIGPFFRSAVHFGSETFTLAPARLRRDAMLVVAARPPWPVAVNVGGVMSTQATTVRRDPDLLGQTVIVIGGSAGISLETARRARAEGARVVLTGRNPERLAQAAHEIGAERTAAFDANEAAELETFFGDLATPADHVMVTAGAPRYRPPFELTPDDARRGFSE